MNYRNKYEGIDSEIVKLVKRAARRAVGKAGLTLGDLPDVEQELMLSALNALKGLPENIKDEKAFVARSVNNRLKSIFRERCRKSRNWRGCCLSLNTAVELDNGDIDEMINLIDSDYLFRNHSCSFADPYQDIDLAGNINAAIGSLPAELQEFCHELKSKPLSDFAREKNMTRKLAAGKLREIRKMLGKQEIFSRPRARTL